MSGVHNLFAYLIAAGMVCFCAVLGMDREHFSSVIQLASTMVGGVAGAMIGHRVGVAAGRAQAAASERARHDSGRHVVTDSGDHQR